MRIQFCKVVVALAAILATWTATDASLIGNPAYEMLGGGDEFEANYSLGFAFRPTVDIDVTALGYYNGVGTLGVLANTHEVAIWTELGDPVALADVQTFDTDLASYTYAELGSPVRLYAGVNYRIAGKASTDDGWHRVTSPSINQAQFPFDSLIEFLPNGSGGGYYTDSFTSSVQYPANAGGHFYAPANFLFVEAPEPASLSLIGFAGLVILSRRRHARA